MFDELTLGTELATAGKQVTQEHINIYADASGDQNPIHTDVEFAKGTMYGGTIAHGLYTLALLSEMLTEVFGNHWINSGTVDIAFLKPVRPGDTIKACGAVTEREASRITCDVHCENQRAEKVLAGAASVAW